MRYYGFVGALLMLGFLVAGCSVPLADMPVIGLPTGAPARPAEPAAYPAIHDMPATRSGPMLDPVEQAKVENDLKAARARQAGFGGQSSRDSD